MWITFKSLVIRSEKTDERHLGLVCKIVVVVAVIAVRSDERHAFRLQRVSVGVEAE